MKNYILSLDQGTTSSRAIVFDRRGQIVAKCQQEFREFFPQPGWVEHDANHIWQSQLHVAREVIRVAGIEVSAIAAIGVANQRETIVLWDRITGEPLAPAIVWQDRRTADRCDALRKQGHAEKIKALTGLVLDPYFSASKLEWLLDHVPGARNRAPKGELAAGTIDSWLIFKLSGAHLTDTSNASRTMLMGLHDLQWNDELLELFRIPKEILPAIIASSGVAVSTFVELFGQAISIAGIAGDQQAATFGQSRIRPGLAKNTYGTGCFMLMHAGPVAVVSKNNLLTTVGWTFESARCSDYLLEGSVFMAGAIIQWLRDCLGFVNNSAEIEALASQVPDAGGAILIPAFTGLGAPHWDASARGTMFGLTRGTTKAHIARAALESIAYQSVDVLDAMQRDAAIPMTELRVDGGASCNDLLMQFQADMLDVPVVRPIVTETTALGVAYLAGLGVQFWNDLDEVQSHWRVDRCFEPVVAHDQRQERLYLWRRALERTRGWIE